MSFVAVKGICRDTRPDDEPRKKTIGRRRHGVGIAPTGLGLKSLRWPKYGRQIRGLTWVKSAILAASRGLLNLLVRIYWLTGLVDAVMDTTGGCKAEFDLLLEGRID
jgi:hypothetical protein